MKYRDFGDWFALLILFFLVSRIAETVLDRQRHCTGLRLEWYVVLLIVVEVLLSLYDLFLSPR
ncbi:hypothetical protein [Nodosilinea sp. LEGE 07088]|uniref:hypothetical protein n=1 Tax=Nodosilinea sp. LEGE 07088 TaxID=2777968 RepID=UPI001D153A38|nr:hypothetical protein [Nodosilinea sp. LEGE 07088]